MSAVSGETKWNIYLHDFWVSALFQNRTSSFSQQPSPEKCQNPMLVWFLSKQSILKRNQTSSGKIFKWFFLNNRAQTTGSWLRQQTWCEVEEGSRGFLKMGWLCFWQKLYHWIRIFDQRGFWPIHLYSGCTTRSGMPRIQQIHRRCRNESDSPLKGFRQTWEKSGFARINSSPLKQIYYTLNLARGEKRTHIRYDLLSWSSFISFLGKLLHWKSWGGERVEREEWFCHNQFLSVARQNIALGQQSAWEKF